MLYYIWPIALVVASNIVYHICAKSVPAEINPLASLTITYLTGAIAAAALYFILDKEPNLIGEYRRLNWAPFALGIAIVGLETGFIYAYKAGWLVNTASVVQSTFLAAALIFVGFFLFKETITLNKIIGIIICLIGLAFINH
ncbi:MAG: EamA family transporter [Clostridiales bacterium]|nr:EamA family transporter [Clostridiales bacterium]